MGPSPPADRYDLANQLFSDALERPPAERAAFVAQKCGGDSSLEQSVMRLLSRYAKLGDFLESPPEVLAHFGSAGFGEGDMIGRFRIVCSLGHGGMGEVYRAEDTELGEVVALKTLRPRLRGEESVSARFREEIRLARKIAHPNICRIFDLFVEQRAGQPILYFTMECLDGPTLAQRLADGILPVEKALAIAHQIAAGLDAAHRTGILHRDLKPSNVILVPEKDGTERAVITDFGLAKALDAAASPSGHTVTGQILGTPDYMAPEQFLAGELSPATDVFALGCVVFEMLSGANPFPADNLVRSGMRRVLGRSEPLSRHGVTPQSWDLVMTRALAPEPEKRYRSAGELVAALEKSQGQRIHIWLPTTRRGLLWGAGITTMAGFGALLRFYRWKQTLLTPAVIMLTPIQYAPGPTDDPMIARGLDAMLARQLGQSAGLTVLGGDRLQQAWERIRAKKEPVPEKLSAADTRHLALRAGGNCVVSGNLFKASDEWVLRLQLDRLGPNPESAFDSSSQEFRAHQEDDFYAAVYRGARWLRTAVRDTTLELPGYNALPGDLTTSSWRGLREYTLGNDAWNAHDSEAAVSHLKAALVLDPGFALAASRLGDILAALGRRDEALDFQSKAADLIRQKDLTDRESLSIAGMFALDTGQYKEAEFIYTRYSVAYPSEALPVFYRADAVESQGRAPEALELSRKAAQLAPKSLSAVFAYGYRLMEAGRFDEAEAQRQAASRINLIGMVDQFAAALAFGRLDIQGCRRDLQRMGQSKDPFDQSKSLAMQACLTAEQSRWEEASSLLRHGGDVDARNGLGVHQQFTKIYLLAQLALRRGQLRDAVQRCREALDMKLDHADTMQTGCLLAQAGDPRGAAKCLVEGLPEWPCYQHWVYRLRAELALAASDAVRALHLLQSAPPSIFFSEWPEALVRAALAAGDRETARRRVQDLVQSPAHFFFQVDVTGPGFIAWAMQIAPQLALPDAVAHQAAALSGVLASGA